MKNLMKSLTVALIVGIVFGLLTFLISMAIFFPIYFMIKGSFDSSGWILVVSACIGWFFFIVSAIMALITKA